MTILPFTGQYERSPLEDALRRALGEGYEVERELGGGGMSRVFLVREIALDRRVAVKVLAPDLAATVSLDRFKREILMVAALQHPHIVGVLSAGEVDGLPFFIMPFVEGESVRVKVRAGRMPAPEAVRILRDVARALAYAHERGVVHRDIKPDNILLAAGSATVTDFGVAKALVSARTGGGNGHRGGTLTGFGTSLGTPTYMAPEQVAADPGTDHRADIYALGITAYEMLAGEPPFTGGSPQKLLAAQLTEKPRSLIERGIDVPPALDALVMRCLEKQPADRPQSAAEVVAALDGPEMVSGTHSMPGIAAQHAGWRKRTVLLSAAAIAILAIGAGLAMRRSGATAGPVDPRSIAVLPIVDVSEQQGDGRLSTGLTEELRSALGRIPGMKVASSTATLAVRQGGDVSAQEMGKKLGVATLLEATLEREGSRVRLSARLVDARDGLSRWSDVFERDAGTLFDVKREVTDALVGAVGDVLAPEDPAAAGKTGTGRKS